MEVLFIVGGVQNDLPEEKPIIDCVEQIDELVVSNKP
jgi:hypothetical protein